MDSPCCEDADNVHKETRPDHVTGLHAGGRVDNGIGSSGHGEHEGIGDTEGAGEDEVERVGAETDGHLGQNWHQNIGTGRVTGNLNQSINIYIYRGTFIKLYIYKLNDISHLSHKGGHQSNDEADQKWGQRFETFKLVHQVE